MRAASASRAALVLLAVVLQLSSLHVRGYSVRYSAKTSASGQMNFGLAGYCAQGDSGHTMMPKLASYQTSAYDVMKSSGFTSAPIGGESRQAACLDANCTWQFSHGLYFSNQLTFFHGVYYGSDGLRGGKVADVYSNFGAGQPVWWSNVSYWGRRQPYMMSDGTWANDNVVTYYTQWVCEYYEYKQSDASIFPTFPDGDVIVPQSTDSYYHCGKRVERDSQGRWIYQRCKNPFPWWAALIIAVICLIVVVAIVITVCCCCFYCDRKKERVAQEEKLETMADNPAQVPTQTELGLSRHASAFQSQQHDDDDESFQSESDADGASQGSNRN